MKKRRKKKTSGCGDTPDAKWQGWTNMLCKETKIGTADVCRRTAHVGVRNKNRKGHIMTKKEKNILDQELWALVALDFDATRHGFEIMQKMLKCVAKEDPGEMTPNKRKVIEEIRLQWRFIKILHEDIGKIAAKFGKSELVPAVPELTIDDDLWDVGKSGASDALYETCDRIGDFQSALQDCAFKLQEVCA